MKALGGAKSLPRWMTWAVTFVVGALVLYPELWRPRQGASASSIIEPGTAISIRLLQPISSANAQPGQPFAAYVVSSESVKGSARLIPGMMVEGVCLAVRRATTNAHPGYIRLVLEGLRDSEGRIAPLETTTFSVWGYADIGGADNRSRDSIPVYPRDGLSAGSATSTELVGSEEAFLPAQENIKFVVLKPSPIPSRFRFPNLSRQSP